MHLPLISLPLKQCILLNMWYNRDLKKEKKNQYSRKKRTRSFYILKDTPILEQYESLWEAAFSGLLPAHRAALGWGLESCGVPQSCSLGSIGCLVPVVVLFVVDLIMYLPLALDPCLPQVRAFVFMLMQFYSSLLIPAGNQTAWLHGC